MFSIYSNSTLKPTATMAKHKAAITTLASVYQSRRSAWTDDMSCHVVTADETGCVTVWEGADAFKYKAVGNMQGDGTPVTAVQVRNEILICGRLDGKIRFYGLVSAGAKHGVWIAASIAMHPWLSCFGTSLLG